MHGYEGQIQEVLKGLGGGGGGWQQNFLQK